MKKYLFFLLALNSFYTTVAQESSDQMLVGERSWRVPRLPVENGEITYTGKVLLEGMTKESLYTKAYYWLKHNLRSDDIDMRVHDKRTGQIAGKGKIMYTQNVTASNAAQGIYFDYDIRLDDGGYTYKLDNFRGIVTSDQMDYSAMYREELNKVDGAGRWTHKYRYEMLSDLNSFVTLFLQGLKAELAR